MLCPSKVRCMSVPVSRSPLARETIEERRARVQARQILYNRPPAAARSHSSNSSPLQQRVDQASKKIMAESKQALHRRTVSEGNVLKPRSPKSQAEWLYDMDQSGSRSKLRARKRSQTPVAEHKVDSSRRHFRNDTQFPILSRADDLDMTRSDLTPSGERRPSDTILVEGNPFDFTEVSLDTKEHYLENAEASPRLPPNPQPAVEDTPLKHTPHHRYDREDSMSIGLVDYTEEGPSRKPSLREKFFNWCRCWPCHHK